MQLDPNAAINNLILQNIQAVTSSAFVAYGIEAMKRSKYFPWLTKEKTTLLRIMSGAGSALSAIGIGTAGEWSAGNHTYTIAISGLCFSCILHSAYAWGRSWIYAQILYDGVISKKTAEPAQVQLVRPVVVNPAPEPAKEAAPVTGK